MFHAKFQLLLHDDNRQFSTKYYSVLALFNQFYSLMHMLQLLVIDEFVLQSNHDTQNQT